MQYGLNAAMLDWTYVPPSIIWPEPGGVAEAKGSLLGLGGRGHVVQIHDKCTAHTKTKKGLMLH